MKKILFISNDFFLPANKNGSAIINANILPLLGKKFTIDFVTTFSRDRVDDESTNLTKEYLRNIIFFQKKTNEKPKKLFQALVDTINYKPFEESLFFSEELNNFILEVDKNGEYDLFFFDLHYAAVYAKNLKTKSVISPHDSLSLLYSRFAVTEPNVFKRLFFRFRSNILKSYEISILPLFERVFFVSDIDSNYISKFCRINASVIPNGTDIPKLVLRKSLPIKSEMQISFWGDLSYQPNFECVKLLCSVILPALNTKSHIKFSLHLIGRGASESLLKFESENIKFKGFVDNIEDELKKTDLFICPMISGAGIKNKVLEAMAFGIPTIGTPFAFDGILCRDGQEVIIVDSVSDIADKVIDLINDRKRLELLVERAYSLIIANYTWEAVVEKYCVDLMDVINAQ